MIRSRLLKNDPGFTLLELVVVFSVIAIISTIGVVSFTNYNKTQELNGAVSDVVNFLNTAKSNSLSQIKTAGCDQVDADNNPVYTLEGYEVTVISGSGDEKSSLTLRAKCSGLYFGAKTITLSKNIKITSPLPPGNVFFYPLFSKNVDGGTICLDAYGSPAKSIILSDLGIVSIGNPC